MPRKTKNSSVASDASPAKSLDRELRALRRDLKLVGRTYLQRIDSEIEEILQAVNEMQSTDEIPAAKIRDLRDMMMLVHGLQIKPDKGRRKDLKKIDSTVGDLRLFLDNW